MTHCLQHYPLHAQVRDVYDDSSRLEIDDASMWQVGKCCGSTGRQSLSSLHRVHITVTRKLAFMHHLMLPGAHGIAADEHVLPALRTAASLGVLRQAIAVCKGAPGCHGVRAPMQPLTGHERL
jgi:hypothetical protein